MELKELAIESFPTTATGKVRKVDIRHIVLEHLLDELKSSTRMIAREPTQAALTRILARFSGVPKNQFSPTMSLQGLLDSITVMRFQSQVKKELGKTLKIEELKENPTKVEQAALLDQQRAGVLPVKEAGFNLVREGPPSLTDSAHALGRKVAFEEVRQEAETKLHVLGLSCDEDVEEVLPIHNFLQYWRAGTESIIFRIGFACAKATTSQLRSALNTVLPRHEMLRTVLVNSALAGPFWAIIRSSKH